MKCIRNLVRTMNGGVKRRCNIIRLEKNEVILKILKRLYCKGYLKSFNSEKGVVMIHNGINLSNRFYLDYVPRNGNKTYYKISDLKRLNTFELENILLTTSKGVFFGDEILSLDEKRGGELIMRIRYA